MRLITFNKQFIYKVADTTSNNITNNAISVAGTAPISNEKYSVL